MNAFPMTSPIASQDAFPNASPNASLIASPNASRMHPYMLECTAWPTPHVQSLGTRR